MTNPENVIWFLVYFGTTLLLLAAFIAAYTLIVPVHELRLIRSGNTAAAVSLGGAMIGFSLPLAFAVMHNDSLVDTILWAAVALVVQLLAFAAMRLLRRDATAALVAGDMAEGVFLASVSVVLGILNAACLT